MDAYYGEIRMFTGIRAPRGWEFCHGQFMDVNQHHALYSVIGTRYGGDGVHSFALPDLRGRTPVGAGQGPGLTKKEIGKKYGAESNQLTKDNMVLLELNDPNQIPDQKIEVGAAAVASESIDLTHRLLRPLETSSPTLGVNYIICTDGLYP